MRADNNDNCKLQGGDELIATRKIVVYLLAIGRTHELSNKIYRKICAFGKVEKGKVYLSHLKVTKYWIRLRPMTSDHLFIAPGYKPGFPFCAADPNWIRKCLCNMPRWISALFSVRVSRRRGRGPIWMCNISGTLLLSFRLRSLSYAHAHIRILYSHNPCTAQPELDGDPATSSNSFFFSPG